MSDEKLEEKLYISSHSCRDSQPGFSVTYKHHVKLVAHEMVTLT